MKTSKNRRKMREHHIYIKGCSLSMLDSITRTQITEMHSKGISIRMIAKKLCISRQSVRKYISSDGDLALKRKPGNFMAYLTAHSDDIKELFIRCEGHCVPMTRELATSFSGRINLRTLQQFCKPFRREYRSMFAKSPSRYETMPGDHLQIDFGEKDVSIGGTLVRIHFFVGVLGYSRRIYVKAFTAENTEAWLNGIESAFRHFDGVPLSIVTDNTRCLVTSHIGHTVKLNERFQAFCHYWNVKPIACTPYKPRSKGKCERMVRYFKENALPGKVFKSIDDLQKWIDLWLVKYSDLRKLSETLVGAKTPIERFSVEMKELRPVTRVLFTSLREEHRKVDSCGLIRVDNNLYKLPEHYNNQNVLIQISDTKIEVSNKQSKPLILDKTTNVYTPKQEEKSMVMMLCNENSADYETWSHNDIGRDISDYEQFTGGW